MSGWKTVINPWQILNRCLWNWCLKIRCLVTGEREKKRESETAMDYEWGIQYHGENMITKIKELGYRGNWTSWGWQDLWLGNAIDEARQAEIHQTRNGSVEIESGSQGRYGKVNLWGCQELHRVTLSPRAIKAADGKELMKLGNGANCFKEHLANCRTSQRDGLQRGLCVHSALDEASISSSWSW